LKTAISIGSAIFPIGVTALVDDSQISSYAEANT
jgi:hypothetical protein